MSTPDNAHKLTGRHLVLFTDDTTRTDIAALNLTTDLVRPATDVEDTFDKLKCFVGTYGAPFLTLSIELIVIGMQLSSIANLSPFFVNLIRLNSSTKSTRSL